MPLAATRLPALRFAKSTARAFANRRPAPPPSPRAIATRAVKPPHPAMKAFVEVIGSGTPDASCSVQVFFDEGRYLFECGDGTQRLCTEYATRLSRLNGIFLSSNAAPSVGGLFGLILTIADAGKDSISITAPTGIGRLFFAARHFCYRPSLASALHEVDPATSPDRLPVRVCSDDNVTIDAVPVRSDAPPLRHAAFGARFDALTYVCRIKDLRGKFNPKRAQELGVEKGRMFGLLQKGQSVTLENGLVVRSSDVMSPSTPGPVVVIAACPTENHVTSLISSPFLTREKLALNAEGPVRRSCLVCHLAPRAVLESEAYRQWCDALGDDVSHIALHHSMVGKQIVFTSQAEDLALLHYSVDSQFFPLPRGAFCPKSPTSVEEARSQVEHGKRQDQLAHLSPNSTHVADERDHAPVFDGWKGNWAEARCKLKFVLSPPSSIGFCADAIRSRFVERKPAHPSHPWRQAELAYASEVEPAGDEMKTPACIASLTEGTAAVHFLGTGAAIPGKHRNVSATLLDLFARGGVLLDCGEGTWGQLVRHMGYEAAQTVVGSMKVVFISHMHADHHLGLLRVLHERSSAQREKPHLSNGPQLVIIGPSILAPWLEAFQAVTRDTSNGSAVASGGHPFRFFDAKSLTDPQTAEAKFFVDAFGIEIGCVEVIHCPLSYGIIIRDCLHGWKVVYSGDTRPCAALAEAGRNATLAIHEATLEDELKVEAIEKMHSTTSEALRVCATDMNAWRTILTHFSQRYPRLPRMDDAMLEKVYRARATVACDLMTVDFTRLEELPKMTHALRDCFPEDAEKPGPTTNDHDTCTAQPEQVVVSAE